MVTPWPRRETWPSPIREHATCLSSFLHEVLHCIERTGTQSLPADLVGDIIRGSLTFVLKMQHTPDLTSISDALRIGQTEAKATAEHTAHTLEQIKTELKNNTEGIHQATTKIQQGSNTAEEARAAAKEATEVGRTTLEMTREIKNKKAQEPANVQ
ncbi:hypothetical protein T440DRAFT_462066 [Plenodomus tracheiphilus IPT5]|uniref:Uncharacterized protein n=1 Tax=Plenodomus tracheiphilus IPT5 TaxID=1408161 RepID=A0A6A7AQV2_9PLEO|nr:hypothetical protein T440DRAFT_462066 [Plenodomus tracheiphilus IPT5]